MSAQWPTFAKHRKKLLVFGSRLFHDCEYLCEKLDKLTYDFGDVILVSGGASGADNLGEWWAFKNRHVVVRFWPDYDKYGKAAPLYRNVEMSQFVNADGYAVGFWDGKSTGTEHMIACCKVWDVKLKVVRF